MDLRLREVWRYRDFIFIYTKNHFVRRYKQTILGPTWLLINPLIQSLINSFLFGVVVGVNTSGIPYLLFHMVSNGLWSFFSQVFSYCAHTFSNNYYLYGKVYFPRLTIPIAYVLIAAIEYAIGLISLLFFSLFFYLKLGFAVNFAGLLILPVLILWTGAMGLGLGIIFSSLTVKYRDLNGVIGILFRLWMYATPVVYPLSQISSDTLRTLIGLNPVTPVIEIYRKLFFGVGEINPVNIIISILFTVTVLFVGIIYFSKKEKNFIDTV